MITTQRLTIRPVNTDDAEAMYGYRSDPEISQFLSSTPSSINDVAEFIAKTSTTINEPGTWFQLVIIEEASNDLVGDIGLHFLDNGTENKQVEVGYTLDKNHRGKGFATEALQGVIAYLIDTLNKHRLIASIDPENAPSIRLVERLGFRKEAHFVESLYINGKWVDDVIYALLAKEWKK